MPTYTANYNFSLPSVGGDLNSWGGMLNGNWLALDTALHTVATEVTPVVRGGTGADNTGAALTNLGLSTNGKSLVTAADYAAMQTLLGIDALAGDFATAAQGDLADALSAMLCGQIAYYAMSTPPTGTLKANGAAVSRTTYARLFAKIGTVHGAGDGVTTFNLPDRRGVFQRGWDDGRGIDAGRVFGSEQLDAFKSHSHSGTAASAGAHTHDLAILGYGDSGGSYPSLGGYKERASNLTTSSAGVHSHSLTIEAAGGAETRPRNVADLAVIFY